MIMQNGDLPTLDDVRNALERDGKHPILLYVEAGKKAPLYEGWQKFTYEQTQTPDYQKCLQQYPNTGVLLGVSDDLCTIDCDTDPMLARMIHFNPTFAATLITKGERGGQLWFYVAGPRPHKIEHLRVREGAMLAIGAKKIETDGTVKIGEFRAEGGQSIIRGIHPCGCHYRWHSSGPPIAIEFNSIIWPRDIIIPWGRDHRSQHQTTGNTDSDRLLSRAIDLLTIDKLWQHFGFEPRGSRNPVSSPFRNDRTPSFSIYDEGRRWKDHGTGDHGDVFDFFQRAMGQDARAAFVEFIELAGLGAELKNRRTHEETSGGKTSSQSEDGAQADCPYPPVDWAALEKAATRSGPRFVQETIYPQHSILVPYMAFARTVCESADTHLIGAILPVVGALLARRVYVSWPQRNIYPNLFNLLVGPAGQRKTDAIKLASKIAWSCLPAAAFLKKHLSTEALFEEYCEESGGLPDKLLLVDDANIVLSSWTKTDYGARVAAEFLDLYDCGSLSESFMRNKTKKTGSGRVIHETSTNAALAGTFNVAMFPLEQIKQGIQRRFMFNVAEKLARTIDWPEWSGSGELAQAFSPLLAFNGQIDMPRSGPVWDFWVKYQRSNRALLNEVGSDNEALSARLATTPTSVLKVAMIFEACMTVHAGAENIPQFFSLQSLEPAVQYVDAHMQAAEFIDRYGARKAAQEQAEFILASVRKSIPAQRPDTIYATRTDLTRKFCTNIGRAGSLTPDDLYLLIIPELIRQGEVYLALKRGKSEVYAFRTEQL